MNELFNLLLIPARRERQKYFKHQNMPKKFMSIITDGIDSLKKNIPYFKVKSKVSLFECIESCPFFAKRWNYMSHLLIGHTYEDVDQVSNFLSHVIVLGHYFSCTLAPKKGKIALTNFVLIMNGPVCLVKDKAVFVALNYWEKNCFSNTSLAEFWKLWRKRIPQPSKPWETL